ncbi:A disintegrin and metalloproteinase with thrombospondin motifs 9 isoform X1 [Polypterus senegalus]|uniref:A disintegrin and metalloproteinase with thrombospondin motifs 9 isoform X1 n=1 Tax=Polypterus senegalus TaxID=55291 RepID=UPI0019665682|nr:A disintegrin and metalloproteinase with thrombospondin motifs 9 isoform X1 [Polypterus senegalus]
MKLVLWALGLVTFVPDALTVASVRSGSPRGYMRQAQLFEIATPRRVDDAGHNFPHDVHFRKRTRRSAPLSDGQMTDTWGAPQVWYKISVFGRDFHLNLTADAGFIAPVYTVSILGAKNVTAFSAHEEDTDFKHCFYSGHVNSQKEHTAVISLCAGMLGTFRSPEGEFFVEPLHHHQGESFEEEHSKPHLVYRKDSSNEEESKKTSACETSGHNHSIQRSKENLTNHVFEDLDYLRTNIAAADAFSKKRDSNETSESGARRRSKRFLSYPRFVEVMVVADSKMVERHENNLQHYVLTLMSIVASIYRDPSIGNLIHIVIVKLVILKSEQDGPAISFNAQTTLKNFCIWQQTQNHPDDSHHSHHDTAVLITRQDICRARDKCDTLGLAELGTVCDPYRSCSISEDNGLSTAFTIAHELGHVFNMPHDDSNKCTEEGVKNQQHVMAPTLNYYTNPWMWSKCSRKYITEFLDTGYGECLLDEPLSRPFSLLQQLPGQIYSVNKQCEFIFGPGTQLCPYMMQCKRLWCTSPEGAQKGCRTQHMPWADGTECEPGKHCHHGVCIVKDQEPVIIDGAWGVWSPFGTCSRTCGGGIKIAVRECNRPMPKNGGKYCVGRRMKFRSCNTEPCAKQKQDFREEQCAAFNGRRFSINNIPEEPRWVPKYSGILMKDRCKLFCRVAGKTMYYQLRDRVIDGTPCGPDTNDICVQGLCRQAGCDHVLNSKARRDKCGICGGDNSSCKTVAGTFNTVHYGYNVVIRIPVGATNIDVRQHSYSGKPEDDNYLAISNSRGEFLLNGEFIVSMFKREIKIGNAIIEYSGSDHEIERINCTDRLDEEITVQVLSVGNLYNPDVRYSFNIPIEDKPQQYFWDVYGPWQECSKLCQGERKRKILCSRESDRVVVSDQRCYGSQRPSAITEPCNTECELRWHIARRSECTAQCGPGYRTRELYCAKYSRSEGKTEKIDDRFCSSQRKPDDREVCHGDCNVGGWQYSSWTECSKSCGGGTRRRGAVCVSSLGGVLDNSKCNQQDKLDIQQCNEFLCPQWKTGDWSECLVTCGKGYKHRQAWCQFGEDRLHDRFCDSSTKPHSVLTCQQQECAAWQVGPWGQCTTTCGPGYQMRAVKCVLGSYGSVVDDTECNAATRPTDTQDCEITACPDLEPKVLKHAGHRTQWRFGSWTQCSATCGKGSRQRYVSCRDHQGGVADDSACSHLPKPPSREVCSVVACGQWKPLEWTLCSVTCGQGKATRQVVCISSNDQVVDLSECDPDDRPATVQECTMSACPSQSNDRGRINLPTDPRVKVPPSHGLPNRNAGRAQPPGANQWRMGPWGACSSTCAGGFQRRAVVCQDENGYAASNCEERGRPVEQRSCESGPCPQWVFGSWGECTKSCGGGVKTRQVVCQRSNGERFSDLSCEILDKPPDREQCNTQGCPSQAGWNSSPWSSCSVTCGRGLKYRTVTCLSKDGTQVDEERCHNVTKPSTQKQCRGGRCPKWKSGHWGPCSQSCGPGTRHRRVICQKHNGEDLSSEYCDSRKRPPETESCNVQPCEFIWITGEWSECSVSCGRGYQRRLVSCSEVYSDKDHYEYGYQVTSNCPGVPPTSIQACYPEECVAPATWRVANWERCSTTCGDGVMQRRVQCLDGSGQKSSECPVDMKPEESAVCHILDCAFPRTCYDVLRQTGISEDGEHLLNILGKVVKIYCAGMQTESPREYITLVSADGENFSEVFGFRLINPTECPYNGSRREDCICRKDYTAAGFTKFSKVRLDINKMQIITTDWLFSQTSEGHHVPFATAGDCYSAAKCPQGRFSVDLSGTGFYITEETKWVSQGNYAVAEMKRSPDGSRVTGKCGGYCGKCTPSSGTGLQVGV